MKTQRFAAGVEYDGARFKGWQSQPGVATVQDALERALGRVADRPVRTVAAGRTDAGVHATGQVAHFDGPAKRRADDWKLGGNSALPDGVSIRWVRRVPDDFHARFAAQRRAYRYVILNQPVRPALFHGHVSWEYRPLDPRRMAEAARHLLGACDFSAFRASSCQSQRPLKTVYRADLKARGRWIWLDVEADGFLQHMVRNVAGVLLAVGRLEREPGWCREVLESRDRRRAAATAPPHGLYLTRVTYEDRYALPEPAAAPVFW